MISGKGWYIWQLGDALIPDADVLADQLVSNGFSHVLIKIADGAKAYYPDLIADYVSALKDKGVIVFGWQYVYLANPALEASRAMERVRSLGLDGLEIDAEGEAKGKGKAVTQAYVDGLAGIGVPVGLSSYRWPSYHPELEWDVFLSICDHVMPQVYWVGANNPGEQLEKCVEEYSRRWPDKAIIPTGSAYHENGWEPLTSEIEEFVAACSDLGLPGYNFWEYANALRYGLFDAVCNSDGGGVSDDGDSSDEGDDLPTVMVRASALNMRAEPSVSGNSPIGTLRRGCMGPVLEERVDGNDRWVRTSIECWVAAEYRGSTFADIG